MDSPQISKDIIESPLFEKSKKKITSKTKLLDDILLGVTFSIATNPKLFPLADEENEIRLAKTDKVNGIPALTFYFKEYEETIVLLDIEPTGS